MLILFISCNIYNYSKIFLFHFGYPTVEIRLDAAKENSTKTTFFYVLLDETRSISPMKMNIMYDQTKRVRCKKLFEECQFNMGGLVSHKLCVYDYVIVAITA